MALILSLWQVSDDYHFRMNSFTDSSKTYHLTKDSCTCPHFKYRKTNCKHMKRLKKHMDSMAGRERPNYKKVRSHTDPSVYYKVSTYRNGRKTCTCPHFKYNKSECKHMLPGRRCRKVRSHTDPSVFYTVTNKSCTCPHFKYRKTKCKHM